MFFCEETGSFKAKVSSRKFILPFRREFKVEHPSSRKRIRLLVVPRSDRFHAAVQASGQSIPGPQWCPEPGLPLNQPMRVKGRVFRHKRRIISIHCDDNFTFNRQMNVAQQLIIKYTTHHSKDMLWLLIINNLGLHFILATKIEKIQ